MNKGINLDTVPVILENLKNAAVFNLPVNSEEAELLDTDQFYEGDLSLYTDFKHPKSWGRKEIRQF